MLTMRLTKDSGNIAGSTRIFSILGEYHLYEGDNLKAIKMLEEAIYVLGVYKLKDYVKIRTLSDYAEALKREERFFESSEIFQNYSRISYNDQDINEEMLFIPEYYI